MRLNFSDKRRKFVCPFDGKEEKKRGKGDLVKVVEEEAFNFLEQVMFIFLIKWSQAKGLITLYYWGFHTFKKKKKAHFYGIQFHFYGVPRNDFNFIFHH